MDCLSSTVYGAQWPVVRGVECVTSGRTRRSRAADDLSGVREVPAEAEQQHRVPGRYGALLDELGEGERDARRRGVPGLGDIPRDDGVDGTQFLGEGLDDPQVRLVQHDSGEVLGGESGALAGLACDGRQLGGGPAVDALPL